MNAAGVLACSLVLSCGARSDADPSAGAIPVSTCPEPESAVPPTESMEPPSSDLGPTFQVVLQNRCAETIWPAWGRTGGLDQTQADPAFWLPVGPGDQHAVTMAGIVTVEVAFWGRTRCVFDQQGNGSCETGDCGGFMCSGGISGLIEEPRDATVYDLGYGFLHDYNVGMSVRTAGCDDKECQYDLGQCPESALTVTACGNAACTGVCPSSASSCCHEFSDGCFGGADITITFCP